MRKYLLLLVLSVTPAPCVAQETDAVAVETFRKAIAAAGGKARFKTIQAPTMWMETGTYYGMRDAGIPFVAQYASYWPKRWYRYVVEGHFAVGLAGDQVTMFRDGESKGQKLNGEANQTAFHQTHSGWLQLLYPLMEDHVLTSIPGVDVDGKPTVGIKAVHDSGSETMLYFDERTHLLMKTQATVFAQEAGGLVKSETFFNDHKSFGGVKLPSKYKVLYDGELFLEGETTAIKTHATIDPAWFGTKGPARVR